MISIARKIVVSTIDCGNVKQIPLWAKHEFPSCVFAIPMMGFS